MTPYQPAKMQCQAKQDDGELVFEETIISGIISDGGGPHWGGFDDGKKRADGGIHCGLR